jgi:hypothetical protein
LRFAWAREQFKPSDWDGFSEEDYDIPASDVIAAFEKKLGL